MMQLFSNKKCNDFEKDGDLRRCPHDFCRLRIDVQETRRGPEIRMA